MNERKDHRSGSSPGRARCNQGHAAVRQVISVNNCSLPSSRIRGQLQRSPPQRPIRQTTIIRIRQGSQSRSSSRRSRRFSSMSSMRRRRSHCSRAASLGWRGTNCKDRSYTLKPSPWTPLKSGRGRRGRNLGDTPGARFPEIRHLMHRHVLFVGGQNRCPHAEHRRDPSAVTISGRRRLAPLWFADRVLQRNPCLPRRVVGMHARLDERREAAGTAGHVRRVQLRQVERQLGSIQLRPELRFHDPRHRPQGCYAGSAGTTHAARCRRSLATNSVGGTTASAEYVPAGRGAKRVEGFSHHAEAEIFQLRPAAAGMRRFSLPLIRRFHDQRPALRLAPGHPGTHRAAGHVAVFVNSAETFRDAKQAPVRRPGFTGDKPIERRNRLRSRSPPMTTAGHPTTAGTHPR